MFLSHKHNDNMFVSTIAPVNAKLVLQIQFCVHTNKALGMRSMWHSGTHQFLDKRIILKTAVGEDDNSDKQIYIECNIIQSYVFGSIPKCV